MKKGFKYYAAVWAILLVIFNAMAFLIRPLPGFNVSYDGRFWTAWVAVMAAFIGQLLCAYHAFKSENASKLFLNIPLISLSYSAAILITAVGGVCMLIPDFPMWLAAVICIAIFGLSAVSVIKAKAAAEMVGDAGESVKAKPYFIKSLTADAKILLGSAVDDEVKAELKKVFEEIRFSDPVSCEALSEVEGRITDGLAALKRAVSSGDITSVKAAADMVITAVRERNEKCKLYK